MATKTADDGFNKKLLICPSHDGSKGHKFTKWTPCWIAERDFAASAIGLVEDSDFLELFTFLGVHDCIYLL